VVAEHPDADREQRGADHFAYAGREGLTIEREMDRRPLLNSEDRM